MFGAERHYFIRFFIICWAISKSLVVLTFKRTSVSSVIIALVSILPSPRTLAPFIMLTPETAYQTPLYSSVEEMESPRSCRVLMGTKTAKKSFPQTSNSLTILSRNWPRYCWYIGGHREHWTHQIRLRERLVLGRCGSL